MAAQRPQAMDIALNLIGTRSALALLQAAFCGARRFDELIASAGVSTMIGATRLREFVEAGLMVKRPYQSRQRVRHEYVLTELGRQCLPVVVALVQVGIAVDPEASDSALLHAGCGAPIHHDVHCAVGHEVSTDPAEDRVAYPVGV